MGVLRRTALALALVLALLAVARAEEADIDLASVSDTLALAQLSRIYAEPWDYIGAIIRVRGTLGVCATAGGGENSLVTVRDAAGCCGQSIEFVPRQGDGNGPKVGDAVIVIGRFEVYQEEDHAFVRLADAQVWRVP